MDLYLDYLFGGMVEHMHVVFGDYEHQNNTSK